MEYNTFDKLFTFVDSVIGEKATFKGLTFTLELGVLIVDFFETGFDNEVMIICDYIADAEDVEPVSFAAKGIAEFKEQIEYYTK